MRFINYLKTKVPALTIIGLTLGLTSCGSYQYVGQDSDGIYGTSKNTVEQEEQIVEVKPETSNSYYQNYFKEKSNEMELASEEGEIFTDIDSYEGTYEEDADDVNIQSGYAGWGQESDNVTVNVYSSGFGFNNFWNRPYYGWNRWGWNRPYSGWNVGFGYGGFGWGGFGWGDPFWCAPYYGGFGFGYAYGNPYNNYYYGRNSYGRRGVAYNSGRRGSLLNRPSVLTNRRTSTRTRSSISNPRTRTRTKASVKPRTRTRVRTNSSQNTIKSNTPRTRTRTRATSTPRTNRSYTPRSSSNTRSSFSSRGGSSRRRG